MHCEYNEEQKQEATQICRMELLSLEYEEGEITCLGRSLREDVRAASAGPTVSLRNLTQLWERMVRTRDTFCTLNSPWLCPGIAACGAVIAKLLMG